MTQVPWSTLAPEQVEMIAAVLIGRERTGSIRLRPGQGDGGVDVLDRRAERTADVLQIKSFTGALTPGQRRQVKESLARVAGNPSVSVAVWHLVIPLNPSPGDLVWFDSLAEGVDFPCHWFGLDRLDDLAARHQDVVDYYVGDGRARLEETIDRLRQFVGLSEPAAGHVVAPRDATEPLAALYQLLNRDDPHYRYEFEVGESMPPISLSSDRRGLVASYSSSDGKVAVTHHVYARYAMATEDRPIPLTFAVRLDAMNDEQRDAWDRAMRYGTGVVLPSPLVTDLSFGLPGGLAGTAAQGTMRIGAAHVERDGPYRLRLRLVDSSGERVDEVVLDMDAPTRGITGTGWRVEGTAPAGAFTVELICDEVRRAGTDVTFGVTVSDLTGNAPAALRAPVRFLGGMRSPNLLQFAPEFGPPDPSTFPVPDPDGPLTTDLVELIDALADIQDHLDGGLVVPDLDAMTMSDVDEVLRAARLVRGETVDASWTVQDIPFTAVGELPDLSSPMQLALSGSSSVTIGDRVVPLDPLTMVLQAATLTVHEVDGETRLHAVPALGNNTMRLRLAPIDQVPPEALGPGDRESPNAGEG